MLYTTIHGGNMNERIKEFMKQAGFGPTANPYERQALDVNMFAELIIRECANIADTAEPYKSSDNILKHFGVEDA